MLYVMSDKIQEVELKYAPEVDGCAEAGPNATCNMEIEIETPMAAPIFVYYQLTNFYQNHRRYVKSRSYSQLMGYTEGDETNDIQNPLPVKDVETDCEPIVTNADLANMGIVEYYCGWTNAQTKTNERDAWCDPEVVWGYQANTTFLGHFPVDADGNRLKNDDDVEITGAD